MSDAWSEQWKVGMGLLAEVPMKHFPLEASIRKPEWDALMSQLEAASFPVLALKSFNPNRKWEAVSAYQKAVRRGDKMMAMKMVSAFLCDPSMLDYLWRRVVVTAAEDIGPADPMLVAFVCAAHASYKPKNAPDCQNMILPALTRMMCEAQKSRTWCCMGVIEGKMASRETLHKGDDGTQWYSENWSFIDQYNEWEIEFCKFLENRPMSQEGTLGRYLWKQGALAEGLSKYYDVSPELEPHKYDLEEAPLICGLPEYAYDMHTKIGKGCTFKLCGFTDFLAVLQGSGCTDKAKAVGWAMFFAEGGLLKNDHWNSEIAILERKIAYNSLGLTFEQGVKLEMAITNVKNDGSLFKLREKAARYVYT